MAGKFAYLCAGATIGGALAMLYAPKPGAETRQSLKALGERGRDRAREGADAVRELYDRREELVDAGIQRVSGAMTAGRDAYQEVLAENEPAGPASYGALGFVALEYVAMLAGYALAVQLKDHLHGVIPKVERLLDTSRHAVQKGSREISDLASQARRVMGTLEELAGNK